MTTRSKIQIKVSSGEEFTIGKASLQDPNGGETDDSIARVQARRMMRELVSVGTDQGKQLHVTHTAYCWLEED